MFVNREQNVINIALPIGISFFLFQLMSYLFDIYYRKAPAQKNILNLGLYISLFPQLIAGPIVRYLDIDRVSKGRWIINLFTVWALTGIWHGVNWTFLFWGLLYFAILLAEKLLSDKIRAFPGFLCHIYTMFVVIIAWVIFRSDSLTLAFGFIKNMFYGGKYGLVDDAALYYLDSSKWLFILGVFFSLPLGSKLSEYLKIKGKYWIITVFNVLVFILSVISCISSTYNPFIYFNF